MNAYLILFDKAATIYHAERLHEIMRRNEGGGRFSVVVCFGGTEIIPHAVYRCPDEAAALALLSWIDEYGEEPKMPEDYHERYCDWNDKVKWDPFTREPKIPDDYPQDVLRYTQASNRKPKDCLLLFRNGGPRGPKGGAK